MRRSTTLTLLLLAFICGGVQAQNEDRFDVLVSDVFKLSHNPSVNSTKLSADINERTFVNIVVYNEDGIAIEKILDYAKIGHYERNIHLSHLTPGKYFIKFQVNDSKTAKQIYKSRGGTFDS